MTSHLQSAAFVVDRGVRAACSVSGLLALFENCSIVFVFR